MGQAEARALVDEARQLYDDAQGSVSSRESHRLEHEALGKLLEVVEALVRED